MSFRRYPLLIVLAVAFALALAVAGCGVGRKATGHQDQAAQSASSPAIGSPQSSGQPPSLGVVGAYSAAGSGLEADSSGINVQAAGDALAAGFPGCCSIVDNLTPAVAASQLSEGRLLAVATDDPRALLAGFNASLPAADDNQAERDFAAMQSILAAHNLVALPLVPAAAYTPVEMVLLRAPIPQSVRDAFLLLAANGTASGSGSASAADAARSRTDLGKPAAEKQAVAAMQAVVSALEQRRPGAASAAAAMVPTGRFSPSTAASFHELERVIKTAPTAETTLASARELEASLVSSFQADYSDPSYIQSQTWLSAFDSSEVAGSSPSLN